MLRAPKGGLQLAIFLSYAFHSPDTDITPAWEMTGEWKAQARIEFRKGCFSIRTLWIFLRHLPPSLKKSGFYYSTLSFWLLMKAKASMQNDKENLRWQWQWTGRNAVVWQRLPDGIVQEKMQERSFRQYPLRCFPILSGTLRSFLFCECGQRHILNH